MLQFYTSSTLGDYIYSLPLIHAYAASYGPVQYVIGNTRSYFQKAERLLRSQNDCIADVKHSSDVALRPGWKNLDAFRNHPQFGKVHIVDAYFQMFGCSRYAFSEPWLSGFNTTPAGYALVNVTDRYRDRFFNWKKEIRYLKERYNDIYFIGSPEEFANFKYRQELKHLKTRDLYEAAERIAEADSFSGTQSSCLAIRQGLGLDYRFEQSPNHCDTNQYSDRETVLNRYTRKIQIAGAAVKKVLNEKEFNEKVRRRLSL